MVGRLQSDWLLQVGQPSINTSDNERASFPACFHLENSNAELYAIKCGVLGKGSENALGEGCRCL